MLANDKFTVSYSGNCDNHCSHCGECVNINERISGLSMHDIAEMHSSDEYWMDTTVFNERMNKTVPTSSVLEFYKQWRLCLV